MSTIICLVFLLTSTVFAVTPHRFSALLSMKEGGEPHAKKDIILKALKTEPRKVWEKKPEQVILLVILTALSILKLFLIAD